MISNIYSKSYLHSSPELNATSKTILYDRLLPSVHSEGRSATFDVLELFHAVGMDFTSAYLFGLSNGTNLSQEVKARKHLLSLYQGLRPSVFWIAELPILTASLARLGFPIIPKAVVAGKEELEAWCLRMCDAAEESLKQNSSRPKPADEENPVQGPVVYKHLKSGMETEASKSLPSASSLPLPDQRLSLASEMMDVSRQEPASPCPENMC